MDTNMIVEQSQSGGGVKLDDVVERGSESVNNDHE